MKSLPNIEKSAFRRFEYVGYALFYLRAATLGKLSELLAGER